MNKPARSSVTAARYISDTTFKKIFLILIALCLVGLPILGLKSGVNADMKFHSYIAKYIVPFYTSFGSDRRVLLTQSETMPVLQKSGDKGLEKEFGINMLPMEDNFKNYGGGFEFFHGLLAQILGVDYHLDPRFHNIPHILLGIVTALILLFGGLVAKEIAGWRAAVLVVILLLISPRFTGQGLMNNKDIPFALGYIMSAYFIIKFLKQLPSPSWKAVGGVVIGLAAALSIRVGGLLLFIYFGMFCVLFWAYFTQVKKTQSFDMGHLKGAVLKALVASVAGYFLGLILWPYGILGPFSHPFEVLKEQSEFPVYINQLFEGKVVSSKDLPWYYTPKFIGMTVPIVVLVGLGACVALFYKFRDRVSLGLVGFVAFIALFPVAYIAYSKANVYNGWRHTAFIYPPLVVLAALGFDMLLELVKKANQRLIIGAVVGVMCIWPAYWSVANIPYQYVYFNPLVGGIEGAFGHYVTDYYMIGAKEATDWLIEEEKILEKPGKVIVGTDVPYPVQVYTYNYKDEVEPRYMRYYARNDNDWDYGIFYSEFVDPAQLQAGFWPPDGTVYTVEAGGVPIMAVVKRLTKADMEAQQLAAAGKYAEAVPKYLEAIKVYPRNEALYSGLGVAYLNTGQMDGAKQAFGAAVKYMPNSPTNYYYLAVACVNSRPPDVNSASAYLKKALELNPGFGQAAQLLQQINGSRGGAPFGQ